MRAFTFIIVFNVIFNVCMQNSTFNFFRHNKRAEEEKRSLRTETRIHDLLYHKTLNKRIQIDTNNVVRYYYYYCYHSRGE